MNTYIDPNDPTTWSPEYKESIERMSRDMRNAAVTLTTEEARFLVAAYYAMQEDRIRNDHRVHKLSESHKPNEIVEWLGKQRFTLERQVARALDAYSAAQPVGVWARSITGIGPIISAGLLAHIHFGDWCAVCHALNPTGCERAQANKLRKLPAHAFTPTVSCPTVGHIWRYAGLDPTSVWAKNTKRPWNADLKRLCFLIGESFVKVSNNPNDHYGKVYKERKVLEEANNQAGKYAAQAAAALAAKKFGDDTEAKKHYETGRLPPARIHLRSHRYATKLFLSHYHHVAFWDRYGFAPPKPYIIEHGGHTHYLAPPNWGAAEMKVSTGTA